jgi:hypothetical protein
MQAGPHNSWPSPYWRKTQSILTVILLMSCFCSRKMPLTMQMCAFLSLIASTIMVKYFLTSKLNKMGNAYLNDVLIVMICPRVML